MGMRRDFPHSCNGDKAPRLVVFEVIKSIEQQSMLCVHRLREG